MLGIFGLSWCVLGFIQAFCGNLLGVGVRVLGPFEGVGVLGAVGMFGCSWEFSAIWSEVFRDVLGFVLACSGV